MISDYETIIGLEVHVELSTKTKIFCGCSTAFGAPVNTNTCPVCLGMPGALPVLNKAVVDKAIMIGLALNCNINNSTRFDRKNYYYPDNPQNYQISQLYVPIGVNGYLSIGGAETEVEIEVGTEIETYSECSDASEYPAGNPKRIRIHEIHMEEDAGKLIHDDATGDTLVDNNRAGVPLIEIVTEPDMRSTEEAVEFLTKLRTVLLYMGVSDCRMNEGSIRADVNLSVRKTGASVGCDQSEGACQCPDGKASSAVPGTYVGDDEGAFGTRTEMKNLNSFKAITRAIDAEAKRQIELLEKGEEVDQETRRWDDDKETSFVMRSKEDAQDYRYFPDPDLPPVHIDDEWINTIRDSLPEFPDEKAARYKMDYALSDYDIGILTSEKKLCDIFEKTVGFGADPKKTANWLLGETLRILNDKGLDPIDITLDPKDLADLISLTDNNTINSTTAKEVFGVIFDKNNKEKKSDDMPSGDSFVKRYVDEHGLGMVSDSSELEKVIIKVIEDNPKSVSDYNAGKTKAIGFLIGQVMKETKGKADPELVKKMLTEKLQ